MSNIIRVDHSKNYTCIANDAIRDRRLSLKARGLHHLLLSYPNNWRVSIEHLSEDASDKDKRTAIQGAIKELEELGYLTREQVRDNKGRITGWESVIRESPEAGFPPMDKTASGKTQRRENPPMGNPTTGNQPLINTDSYELSKEEVSTPPTPHRGNESESTLAVEIVEREVSPPPSQESVSQLTLFAANTNSGLDCSSGRVATKQKLQVDYQPLIDLYNEYKPTLWRKSSLTPDRERSLKQLFNLHKEALAEKMIDALKWADTDEFWSGRKNVKSGSKKKFDIDTLTRDGRVQKWAEYLHDDGQSLSPGNQKLAENYAYITNALNSTGGFFDD